MGVRRDYRILNHKAGITVTTDRVVRTPPWGLFGGKAGEANITVVFRNDGSQERWRKISNLPLEAGEVVSFQTGGGGGYGSPLERDPHLVLQDVVNGYVSLTKARDDYGVVIEGGNQLDLAATKELRRRISAKELQDGSRGRG